MKSFNATSLLLLGLLMGCGNSTTVVDLPGVNSDELSTAARDLSAKENAQSEVSLNPRHPLVASEIKPVILRAQPYMSVDHVQLYATLYVECQSNRIVSAGLILRDDPEYWESLIGVLPSNVGRYSLILGDAFNPHPKNMWHNTILFDDQQVSLPIAKYRTLTKQRSNGKGGFESFSERILIRPTFNEVLLPLLKTAKVMDVKEKNGLGPTFDLTAINSDVERLEAECTPEVLGE